MANRKEYNDYHRDQELIEFTKEELLDRLRKGLPLSYRQRRDAEIIAAARTSSGMKDQEP